MLIDKRCSCLARSEGADVENPSLPTIGATSPSADGGRRDALRNLAGSWIDSRTADEIAKDIERHRTAGRRVDL